MPDTTTLLAPFAHPLPTARPAATLLHPLEPNLPSGSSEAAGGALRVAAGGALQVAAGGAAGGEGERGAVRSLTRLRVRLIGTSLVLQVKICASTCAAACSAHCALLLRNAAAL